VKIRNIRDVAEQVMTKADQEGLIVRNVINKDDAGTRRIILLSVELPPGTVHLLHRHPNAEQIMYVLEGSCLALSEGEPVRLNEGDAVFIAQGEWHGVSNDTGRPAVTLIIYGGLEPWRRLATRSTRGSSMERNERYTGKGRVCTVEKLATRNPWIPDTTPTPPGTQYGTTRSKAEKGNRLRYAVIASSCKPMQHSIYHS
jgi:quercetin dioxygenase-like cupin family protein